MKMSILDRMFHRNPRTLIEQLSYRSERDAALDRIASLCQQKIGVRRLLIGVIGPAGGEGSTLISTGLAASFAAQPEHKVIYVDTMGPSPSRNGELGFYNWLASSGDLSTYLQMVPGSQYQRLPSGMPLAQLGPTAWGRLSEALRAAGDVVICDLASPLVSPECLHLATRLDGVLLVLEAEETRWQVARSAQRLLENAQVRILGTVLNKRRHFIPDSIYRLL
jgi:protein-tyrosine kinase